MITIKETGAAPHNPKGGWAIKRLVFVRFQLDMAALLLLASMWIFTASAAHAESTVSPIASARVEINVSVRPHYRLEIRKVSHSEGPKRAPAAFCLATNMRAFAIHVTVANMTTGATIEQTADDIEIAFCGQSNFNAASRPPSLADVGASHWVLVRPE